MEILQKLQTLKVRGSHIARSARIFLLRNILHLGKASLIIKPCRPCSWAPLSILVSHNYEYRYNLKENERNWDVLSIVQNLPIPYLVSYADGPSLHLQEHDVELGLQFDNNFFFGRTDANIFKWKTYIDQILNLEKIE